MTMTLTTTTTKRSILLFLAKSIKYASPVYAVYSFFSRTKRARLQCAIWMQQQTKRGKKIDDAAREKIYVIYAHGTCGLFAKHTELVRHTRIIHHETYINIFIYIIYDISVLSICSLIYLSVQIISLLLCPDIYRESCAPPILIYSLVDCTTSRCFSFAHTSHLFQFTKNTRL